MNFVLFLLHLLLSSHVPTITTPYHDGNTSNTVATDPGKDKGGKFQDGDYVIWSDILP